MIQPILRFAQSKFVHVDDVDPAKIRVLEDYHMVRTLYSPLLEYTANGKITGGIAEKFYWDGSNLVFEIRRGYRSSSGDLIDARDAEISLRRLLILESNSHGDLGRLLCGNKKLQNLEEPCPNIAAENQKLILKFDKKRHYLIPMFSNMDFAILPRKVIDPVTLKIKDHKNSTGPYKLVYEDPEKKQILVTARPEHWHFSPRIPQQVLLSVPKSSTGSDLTSVEKVEALKQGEVDVLSTFSAFDLKAGLELVAEDNNISLFKTQNIAKSLLVFTRKGQSRYTPVQRAYLGKLFRKKMADYFSEPTALRKPTFEYFPRSGAGHLESDKVEELEKFINALPSIDGDPLITEKVEVGIAKASFEFGKKMFGEEGSSYRVVPIEKFYLDENQITEGMPDAVAVATDVGFNEDLSLLFYTESIGAFPYGPQNNRAWLDKYMLEEDEAKRLEMMKHLHYDMLKNAAIVPLATMPYTAMTRKPWKLNFSNQMAGSPLWLIEYQE